MIKIDEGKYEVSTTREDAIEKFMQLQGDCRSEISGELPIEFSCFSNGEIMITHPIRQRHVENSNSTNLFAKIEEQDGKTYVTYYTAFDTANRVLKAIVLIVDILLTVAALALAIIVPDKKQYLILFVFALLFYAYRLFTGSKEKKNAPKDSEVLIRELENRVQAVNLWDK